MQSSRKQKEEFSSRDYEKDRRKEPSRHTRPNNRIKNMIDEKTDLMLDMGKTLEDNEKIRHHYIDEEIQRTLYTALFIVMSILILVFAI